MPSRDSQKSRPSVEGLYEELLSLSIHALGISRLAFPDVLIVVGVIVPEPFTVIDELLICVLLYCSWTCPSTMTASPMVWDGDEPVKTKMPSDVALLLSPVGSCM